MARQLKFKHKVRLFVAFCLLLGFGSFGISLLIYSPDTQSKALESKTDVTNLVKSEATLIKVTPSEIQFKLYLESYQNAEFIQDDLLETTLLTNEDDDPIEPVRWEEEKKTPFSRKGILTFQNTFEKPRTLILHIFVGDEQTITWNLETLSRE